MRILILLMLASFSFSQVAGEETVVVFSDQVDDFITRVNNAVISENYRYKQNPWSMERFIFTFQVDFFFNVDAGGTTIQTFPEFIFHYERPGG